MVRISNDTISQSGSPTFKHVEATRVKMIEQRIELYRGTYGCRINTRQSFLHGYF